MSQNAVKLLSDLDQWMDAIEFVFPGILKSCRKAELDDDIKCQRVQSLIYDINFCIKKSFTWTAFKDRMVQYHNTETVNLSSAYQYLLQDNNALPVLKMALTHVLIVQSRVRQNQPSTVLHHLHDYGEKWVEVGFYIPLMDAYQLALIPMFNTKKIAHPYEMCLLQIKNGAIQKSTTLNHCDLEYSNSIEDIILVRLRLPNVNTFDVFVHEHLNLSDIESYTISSFSLSKSELLMHKLKDVKIDLSDLKKEASLYKEIDFTKLNTLPVNTKKSVCIENPSWVNTFDETDNLFKVANWMSKVGHVLKIAELNKGEWLVPIKMSWLEQNETIQAYFDRITPQLPFSMADASKLLNPYQQ